MQRENKYGETSLVNYKKLLQETQPVITTITQIQIIISSLTLNSLTIPVVNTK